MEYFDKTQNERDLSLFRTVANTGCEIVKDCILPDTYGDVKKLLATSARLTPHADRPEEDGVSYSGSVAVTVLFLTEDGEVASITADCDYDARLPLETGSGVLRVASFPTLENLQSRLVNPRKIGIRARLKPNVYLLEDADTSVSYPDSVTDEELLTFEEKTARVSYTTFESFRSEGIESGDDLMIDAPNLPIESILMSDLHFSSVSAEAREGAVAINGNADITLWYLGDKEGERVLCSYRHTLPVSTLVECEGVKEGHTVCASLYCEQASFSPEQDGQGESRVCECDFTYSVNVLAAREAVGFCTKDLYSTRFETALTYGDCRIAKRIGKATASARGKTVLALKEGLVPLGSHALLRQYRIEPSDDARSLLCGNATVFVMLQNRESGLCTGETVDLPFSVALALPYDSGRDYAVLPSVGFSEVKAVGEELTVSLSVSCTVLSFEAAEERAVVSATPTAESDLSEAFSFTVYYPREGESTWDIAKKYRVREDSLILADSEEFRRGKNRRAVMIPAKKNAVYHEIITE